jgi:filamentous hemagglutinin
MGARGKGVGGRGHVEEDGTHQPSYAAQKKALENQLGRELSPTEAKALRDSTPAVASPRTLHQRTSPTYGGRNTTKRSAEDAQDLQRAQARDRAEFDKAMEER